MGTQIKFNFGYGIKAPKDRAHIDFWDEVEDNFPLLSYNLSGDYWNQSEVGAVIAIESSMASMIGYGTIPVNKALEGLDSAGQLELERFMAKYCPKAVAQFRIWAYIG
jgi:hypothetical protein